MGFGESRRLRGAVFDDLGDRTTSGAGGVVFIFPRPL